MVNRQDTKAIGRETGTTKKLTRQQILYFTTKTYKELPTGTTNQSSGHKAVPSRQHHSKRNTSDARRREKRR